MKTSADTRNIGMLLKGVREQSLIPKPHFQRRAVWTNRDKVAFIKTILEGYPFPEIYVAAGAVNTQSGDTTEVLVDGQQRIRTIDEYFRGARPFRVNKSITLYRDLTENEKKKFLSYDVALRNLGILEDSEIREVFRRMNSTSYDLNDIERYNAVYLGEFKRFSEAMAQLPFFAKFRLFSPNDIRRMKDVAYAASLTATMMSNYFHRDEEIETYLETYNEQFDAKDIMAARVIAAVTYLDELTLPADSRAWGKSDFYTLFIEIDRQLGRNAMRPDPAAAGPVLVEHFKKVADGRTRPPANSAAKRYFDATLQNVNDRGNRIIRGEVIRELLESVPLVSFAVDPTGGTAITKQLEQDRTESDDGGASAVTESPNPSSSGEFAQDDGDAPWTESVVIEAFPVVTIEPEEN